MNYATAAAIAEQLHNQLSSNTLDSHESKLKMNTLLHVNGFCAAPLHAPQYF